MDQLNDYTVSVCILKIDKDFEVFSLLTVFPFLIQDSIRRLGPSLFNPATFTQSIGRRRVSFHVHNFRVSIAFREIRGLAISSLDFRRVLSGRLVIVVRGWLTDCPRCQLSYSVSIGSGVF